MQAEARVATTAQLLPGFGVLFEKEVAESRRSKRMIIFLVIMTVAVLLIPLIGYFTVDDLGDGGRITPSDSHMHGMTGTWAVLVGYLASFMVIAATVDAVTRERALGITAWIATKPVSRLSYLLAKACAETTVAAATIVIIPTVLWLAVSVVVFRNVPVGDIIVAMGILVIEVAFLAFLIVGLGVIFRTVAPIAIIALALWFIPNTVPIILTQDWAFYVIPSYLPFSALSAAVDEYSRFTWTVPASALIIATAAFTAAFLQFERQEL
jgi:ABC-type transport system involved in multi-copper enzyme maturation permease subunit